MAWRKSPCLALVAAAAMAGGCGPVGTDASGTDAGGGGGSDGAVNGVDSSVPPDPRFVEIIRGLPYPRLVLEVDAVVGFEADALVAAELETGLAPVLDKPGGIEVAVDGVIASMGASYAWTFGDLAALADATFDRVEPADTIKVHVLFVDGHSADDAGSSRILGMAWGYLNIAIFAGTIQDICRSGANALLGPLVQDQLCRNVELGVWTHEMGHVIGLVDNGLPMIVDHRDPDPMHGAHDASDQCVMFWATEGESFVDVLRLRLLGGDDSSLGFDQACLDDVAAVRDGT